MMADFAIWSYHQEDPDHFKEGYPPDNRDGVFDRYMNYIPAVESSESEYVDPSHHRSRMFFASIPAKYSILLPIPHAYHREGLRQLDARANQ